MLEQLAHRDLLAVHALALDYAGQVGLDRLVELDLTFFDHFHNEDRHKGLRVRPNPHLPVKRRRLTGREVALSSRRANRIAVLVRLRSQRARVTVIDQGLNGRLQIPLLGRLRLAGSP